MEWYWIVIYFINLLIFIFNIEYILAYRSSHRDYIKYVEWYKKNKMNKTTNVEDELFPRRGKDEKREL